MNSLGKNSPQRRRERGASAENFKLGHYPGKGIPVARTTTQKSSLARYPPAVELVNLNRETNKAVRGADIYEAPRSGKGVGVITREDRSLRGESPTNLSERQAHVLRLSAWGYSSKEIAAQLAISIKTVESHKATAMRKLDLNSRVDIVRYALLQGWFEE